MPTRDSAWPNGTPCWVDYCAPDVEAAKAFYTSMLGWEYEGGGEEFGGYTIFNEPGSVVWNELGAEDPDAARSFCSAVFGFRFDEIEGAEGYTTFATDERPLGGLSGRMPGGPEGWTTCFSVANTDEAVEAAVSGGAKVLMPAQDTQYGRFAVVADPGGVAFSVMQATDA